MVHPAHLISAPNRPADVVTSTAEIYLEEKIIVFIYDYRDVVCLMDECPVTGLLMYMTPNYPIAWTISIHEELNEAYVRLMMEKHLLNK